MKEVKLYQCEVCGTRYADKLKAKECEKYHATGLEIIDCKYHGMNVCGNFPVKITLRAKSGEEREYKL